jgi:ribosomal protein S18 acetylase RimI-like enzyme
MQKGNVVKLLDGTEVTLRLMTRGDAGALKFFFSSLSKGARQFLYDDVTDPEVVDGWAMNINYDNVLPIVAVVDGEIVADATLHKRDFGPLRHVGRVRIVVREDFSGRGLDTILTREIILIARGRGLKIISAMLAEQGEKAAIETLGAAGFSEVARIPGYFMDFDGNLENVVLMMKKL